MSYKECVNNHQVGGWASRLAWNWDQTVVSKGPVWPVGIPGAWAIGCNGKTEEEISWMHPWVMLGMNVGKPI